MDFVKGIFKIDDFAFSLKSDKKEFNRLPNKVAIWDESDAILMFKDRLCLGNGFEGNITVCFNGNKIESIRIMGCEPCIPANTSMHLEIYIDMDDNVSIKNALCRYGNTVEYVINADGSRYILNNRKARKAKSANGLY